jgi:uncharacterized alpha-E superfamily protein
MLSRVADALFWMSRYLERAEHTARLLDTTLLLDVDLRGVDAGAEGRHWQAVADVLQLPIADRSPEELCLWVTSDPENSGSILSCINRARNNARSIRGSLGPEVWRALNKLYWQLKDPEFAARAVESPHEFYEAVEAGSHLFQGVCDATLPHDEGWQFLQLGRYLERSDKTLRILAAKADHLRGLTSPADLPIATLEWAGLLKACRSYEAYQRVYIGRVEADQVIDFVLLQPQLPRSVRFSLESTANALAGIEGRDVSVGEGALDKIVGRTLGDVRYAELDHLLRGDLTRFLTVLIGRCHAISRGIQERYALVT